MTRSIDQNILLRSYNEASAEQRTRFLKVSCLLVFVITLSGIGLDQLVYPQLSWDIFKARVLCVLLTLGIFGLCFTPLGRRHISILGIIWASVVQISICYMILISEGAMSPYYAGLNLVILGVAVFLPWTFLETLTVCAITLLGYLAACLLHDRTPLEPQTFYNNVAFLIFTNIICSTSSFFTSRARFAEFRLRYELDARNHELAELDRLKSEFFANVSHELRTPLTLIIAPLDEILRQRNDLPAQAYDPLVVVRHNALRLLKLINDLLEIVRLEDGRSKLKKERLDLALQVPAMVDSIRHLALTKGLKVFASGDKSLDVFADANRLEKAFLNILMNAIKFTPAGGTISVRWHRENSTALLEIEDTGTGISEKELPFIFDRFRQADGSSTRKHQGMGIGLALARELIQEHGGKLEATSRLNSGSTFRIELPDSPAQLLPPEPKPTAKEDPVEEIYMRSERIVPAISARGDNSGTITGEGEFTILVVDDEPDMRRFLVSVLAESNRVIQADNGRSGLELAIKHHPDLVVLDLMLPEMNGLDVCRSLKQAESTSDMRIVLLTARGDEQTKIDALERGADDFLTKPFSTLEVRTRISNLLRTARAEKELRHRNVELQQTLKTLKETESQLVQSEKMNALGSLAAGLLHEINNPLNYTFMALQLAQNALVDKDADLQDTLKDISDGMTRIRDIITDLRAFAYPSTSEHFELFKVKDAIDSALRMVSHETKGITIDINISGDGVASGSKSQVIQVLVNLLMNACKAIHADKDRAGRIDVDVRQDSERIVTVVRDNGCGMSAEVLPRIFDPFFTTRPVGEGMGLGLSICHTIIKKHGGSIKAISCESEFTEFSFDLQAGNREVRTHGTTTGLQAVGDSVCR
jgi:signal transduction histidine kinase